MGVGSASPRFYIVATLRAPFHVVPLAVIGCAAGAHIKRVVVLPVGKLTALAARHSNAAKATALMILRLFFAP